jgi:hypothetical protein
MPRARRPTSRPSPETWEVAVVPSPAQADDGPVLGVGLAVDVTSGQVRWASPVGALSDVVPGLLAASKRYGAPEALCYDDPELEEPLVHLAATLSIDARRLPCPTLERAERALLTAMAGGMPAAGVSLRVDAWRRILDQMLGLAPWQQLGERVWFRFTGMGLDGAVAVLIGELDEAWGLTLYPSEAALVQFINAATEEDHQGVLHASTLSVQLERSSEVPVSDVSICRSLELLLAGGRLPRLLALGEGAVRAPTRSEQKLLLAAVEGVTTLCTRDLDALAQGQQRRIQMIVTGGQRLEVTASPAELTALEPPADDLPSIIEADHTVVFGSMILDGLADGLAAGAPEGTDGKGTPHPSVVVKLRKRDAIKLAAACDWIESLALHRRGAGLQLVACDEHGARGTLVKLWGGGLDELSTHLASAGKLYLAISSGGPTRPEIRSAEFVYAKVLPVARTGPATRSQ